MIADKPQFLCSGEHFQMVFDWISQGLSDTIICFLPVGHSALESIFTGVGNL